MKVIDLLNKIANGEIPEHIRYNNLFMTYDKKRQNYYDRFDAEIDWKYTIMQYINDEVEIIEDTPKEDKKIEKLDLEELNDLLRADLNYDNLFHKTHKMLVETKSKINEIIDKINGE